MREEILAFLKRANDAGDVVIDLCDTGPSAGIVQTFETGEIEQVETCADMILGRAQSDCAGRSGKVRFELIAIRAGKRWARQALVIDAGGGAAFGAEDATLQGIIIELVRDKREIMRMAVSHTDNIMGRLQSMVDLQAKQLLSIEEQRIHMYEVVETLVQHKHEREVAVRQGEQDAKNTAHMVESFVPMIAAAGNKLLGQATGDAMPLGPEVVASFLQSFDEDQLQKISSVMNPMQGAAFFQIMEAVTEAKEKKDKALSARVNGTGGNG